SVSGSRAWRPSSGCARPATRSRGRSARACRAWSRSTLSRRHRPAHYPKSVRRAQFENPSAGTPVAEIEPTITATFKDGPLNGSSIEAEVVEGRPPKTSDVSGDDGSGCHSPRGLGPERSICGLHVSVPLLVRG